MNEPDRAGDTTTPEGRSVSTIDTPTSAPPTSTRRLRIVRLVAVVTGLLGALLALATPLLPVNQTTAQLSWPQQSVGNIAAPLASTPLTARMSMTRQ